MRLQLNLNQYYEGLEPWQVNTVFSMFASMQPHISRIKQILNNQKENKKSISDTLVLICRANVIRAAREINTYMVSIGKEEIFVIGDSWKNTDFEAIVSKYEYLMSEPDVDTQNTDALVSADR